MRNKSKASEYAKKRWKIGTKSGEGRNPFCSIVASAKSNSSVYRRGVSFEVDNENIERLYNQQKGLCAISGIPMLLGRNSNYSISIDRIDNNIGYVLTNIRLVCKCVNLMRNVLSDSEFLKICKSIVDYNSIGDSLPDISD